jgi:hypothetical protein
VSTPLYETSWSLYCGRTVNFIHNSAGPTTSSLPPRAAVLALSWECLIKRCCITSRCGCCRRHSCACSRHCFCCRYCCCCCGRSGAFSGLSSTPTKETPSTSWLRQQLYLPCTCQTNKQTNKQTCHGIQTPGLRCSAAAPAAVLLTPPHSRHQHQPGPSPAAACPGSLPQSHSCWAHWPPACWVFSPTCVWPCLGHHSG